MTLTALHKAITARIERVAADGTTRADWGPADLTFPEADRAFWERVGKAHRRARNRGETIVVEVSRGAVSRRFRLEWGRAGDWKRYVDSLRGEA